MTTISFMSESCHPRKSSIRHVVLVICTRIQMLFCKALINGSGGLRLHTTLLFLHSGMVGNDSATGLDFFNQTQICEKKQLQVAPRSVFCLHLIGMCTPKASESLTSKQQTRVISQNPSEK